MTRSKRGVLAMLIGGSLMVAGLQQSDAQGKVETGFLNRTVDVKGATYKYQVYVPAEYASQQQWPVILFLHGAGERGKDGLLQTQVGLPAVIRGDVKKYPAIVVMPQVPPDSMWSGDPAEAAMLALETTLKAYATDADRVYLTGLSMGGNGSFYLGYRFAEKFAAVVPICGWITPWSEHWHPVDVVAPGDEATAFERTAQKLAKTPVWIFHGEMDNVVPVGQSRKAAEALMKVNPQAKYTEVAGTGHNSWDNTYNSASFIAWLFAQKKH
ncbi:MAG: prolyl oligopeptidase family serine peptidase [Ignavibacteriae bacterium]|nr:prolyl oligopeptidase family serine peptidase [Ignavibacteriota bacterium]